MNKSGHMWVTKRSIPDELKEYSMWLQGGSILPDIFLHTYLFGHTWNTSFERTMKKLENLEQWGEVNGISCLYLGALLHYIEDYFTFSHNEKFTGDIAEHVMYEKQLMDFLQNENAENHQIFQDVEKVVTIANLRVYLEELHQSYMHEKQGFAIDRAYIQEAAKIVCECFATILHKNKHFYDAATLEAMQLSSQNYYYFIGSEANV